MLIFPHSVVTIACISLHSAFAAGTTNRLPSPASAVCEERWLVNGSRSCACKASSVILHHAGEARDGVHLRGHTSHNSVHARSRTILGSVGATGVCEIIARPQRGSVLESTPRARQCLLSEQI